MQNIKRQKLGQAKEGTGSPPTPPRREQKLQNKINKQIQNYLKQGGDSPGAAGPVGALLKLQQEDGVLEIPEAGQINYEADGKK